MKDLATIARFNRWNRLLKRRSDYELAKSLEKSPVVDVAEFLEKKNTKILVKIISLLSNEIKAGVFENLTEVKQMAIYHYMRYKEFSTIFSLLQSDQRADFYQRLNAKEQTKLLPYLNKQIRSDVITLSSYDPSTAGGIMSTDFAKVISYMTAKEAIDRLKEDAPSNKMFYYLYVVNEDMEMVGVLSLKDLIIAEPESKITEIINKEFIYSYVDDDKESVAHKIQKYDIIALPILNEDKQLVGIVRYDEAMDVITDEQTEDMERFMGIVPQEEHSNYLETSSINHFKKRIIWVIGLFLISFFSGFIMHKYEEIITRLTILALYIPSITDTGGNAGSQAATVIIRALSLDQITLSNWLTIIIKEVKVSLLISICLFALAFSKVIVLSGGTVPQGYSIYKLALVIALSISIQVVISAVIGATLPLIAKKFKGDPAVAASPAITTLVDITGIIIYFSIITTLLK